MSLSPGRIVHVRIGGTDDEPELRPGIVVKAWGADCANLQVFLDGLNDLHHLEAVKASAVRFDQNDCARGLVWATSVCEGTGVGEWRWPART